MVSSGVWNGSELEAEFFGAPGEVMHDSLAITFLVVVLALVGVFLWWQPLPLCYALGQHRVDQSCELVGGGRDGLGLIHTRAHAPEVGAQCRLAGAQRCCG